MLNSFKTIASLIAVLICIFPLAAHASHTMVEVRGMAPVIAGDLAQARDEALVDARIRAIEQAAGITIDARTTLLQDLMEDHSSDQKLHGIIVKETIISEGLEKNGLFTINMKAEVATGDARSRLNQLLEKDTICLRLEVSGVDMEAQDIFDNLTRSELSRLGYGHILQSPQYRGHGNAWQEVTSASCQADIAISGMVDVTSASDFGHGVCSARVTGWMEVRRTSENTVLAYSRIPEVKGFGSTKLSAANDAVQAIARRLVEATMGKTTPRHVRRIAVVIEGVNNFSMFKWCKNYLAAMRWVSSLSGDQFSESRTVFYVDYGHKAALLASRLNRTPHFDVVGFSHDTVRLRAAW